MGEVTKSQTRVERLGQLMQTAGFRWGLVVAFLAMLAVVRAALPSERDQYWSARAGVETLAGSPLARPDTWSWSTDGVWYPNSPAWNVVLGLGWQSLGFWGLFWVAFVSMSALFGLTVFAARVAGARPLPTLLAFVPILVLASSALSPRATVVVQALVLGAALFAWWWGGRASRVHVLLAAAVVAVAGLLLSFAGNWVHLSFMLMAAVVAVMWAVAWWMSPGMSTTHRVVLTVAGTAGLLSGCLLSPYGVALTLERAQAVSDICQGLIIEWTSVWTATARGDVRWILVAAVAVSIAVASGLWVVRVLRRHGRFDPRARLVVPLAVFAVPVTLAGVGTIRFLAMGMLAILPIAAAAATALVDVVHRRQRMGGGVWANRKLIEYSSGRFWVTILTGVAILLAPLVAVVTATGATPPEATLAESLPEDCDLLSDTTSAGPVILTRPDVQVWIDGRVDFYGRQHLIDSGRIYAGLDPIPEPADCVLLRPGAGPGTRLAQALDGDPAWDRTATLDGYVAWVRR